MKSRAHSGELVNDDHPPPPDVMMLTKGLAVTHPLQLRPVYCEDPGCPWPARDLAVSGLKGAQKGRMQVQQVSSQSQQHNTLSQSTRVTVTKVIRKQHWEICTHR